MVSKPFISLFYQFQASLAYLTVRNVCNSPARARLVCVVPVNNWPVDKIAAINYGPVCLKFNQFSM